MKFCTHIHTTKTNHAAKCCDFMWNGNRKTKMNRTKSWHIFPPLVHFRIGNVSNEIWHTDVKIPAKCNKTSLKGVAAIVQWLQYLDQS